MGAMKQELIGIQIGLMDDANDAYIHLSVSLESVKADAKWMNFVMVDGTHDDIEKAMSYLMDDYEKLEGYYEQLMTAIGRLKDVRR